LLAAKKLLVRPPLRLVLAIAGTDFTGWENPT